MQDEKLDAALRIARTAAEMAAVARAEAGNLKLVCGYLLAELALMTENPEEKLERTAGIFSRRAAQDEPDETTRAVLMAQTETIETVIRTAEARLVHLRMTRMP